MLIDLLYFDGCPSWQVGLENLKAALSQAGLQAEIQLIRVADNAEANRLHFLGSPSFHINGMDLWPEQRDMHALSCRVYPSPQGMKGAPTVEILRAKLRSGEITDSNHGGPS